MNTRKAVTAPAATTPRLTAIATARPILRLERPEAAFASGAAVVLDGGAAFSTTVAEGPDGSLLTIVRIRRNPIVTLRDGETVSRQPQAPRGVVTLAGRDGGCDQKGKRSSRSCATTSASLYRLTQAATARAVSMMSRALRISG